MKSLKKTLVLLVVFSMILSTLVPAFAFDDVVGEDCEEQVTRMVALGILDGMGDGTFQPEGTITRAQMAKIICYMTGVDESLAETSKNTPSKFDDVATGAWYTGYVNIASNNGIINGYPDGKFRPEQELTMNEVLTLCVKALGRGGYVEKTGGTWPANYIAEAARLNLLKDVENQAVANRGNVAIISWNTLNSKEWTRTGEEINGVNFGDGEEVKTLLAIHFPEFTTEETGKFKEIEGIKVGGANGAIIDDRQLEIDAAKVVAIDDYAGFAEEFDSKPRKNSDEASYKVVNNQGVTTSVKVYVPEDVCEDLDELKNKTITIILGKDNVAALIFVEDDVVDTAFLTKYDDNKITVDGESYKLASGFEVTLNGYNYGKQVDGDCSVVTDNPKCTTCNQAKDAKHLITCTADSAVNPLTDALDDIHPAAYDTKDIVKAIEATIVLDEDDKVCAIDLFTSATITNTTTSKAVSTEAVVKKVKEAKKTYTISLTGNAEMKWDLEDEEEMDFPKVYVDGVKGDIKDIEAGNVLTIIYDDASDSEIKIDSNIVSKIYVSTNAVEGEVSRVKNDLDIYVDGTKYLISADKYYELADDEDFEDIATIAAGTDASSLHGEAISLYTNIFGEYVVVKGESVDTDWTFAVVDNIYKAEENEEEDGVYSQKLRLFMLNGDTVKTYKLVYDNDDYYDEDGNKIEVSSGIYKVDVDQVNDADDAVDGTCALSKYVEEDVVIAFKANADGEIELEDVFQVVDENGDLVASEVNKDYVFTTLTNIALSTDDSEYKEINHDSKRVELTHKPAYPTSAEYNSNASGDYYVLGTSKFTAASGAYDASTQYYVESDTRFKVTVDTEIANIENKKVVEWSDLVKDTDKIEEQLSVNSIMITKKDETAIAYILTLGVPAASTDVQYAVVVDAEYTISSTKTNVLLQPVDGSEAVAYENKSGATITDGMLIAYTVSNGKIQSTDFKVLIDDIAATNELDDVDTIDGYADVEGSYVALKQLGAYVAKDIDVEGNSIEYVTTEDVADGVTVLTDRYIDIDPDATVIDLRGLDKNAFVEGFELETLTFDTDLETETVLFFGWDVDEEYYSLIVVID